MLKDIQNALIESWQTLLLKLKGRATETVEAPLHDRLDLESDANRPHNNCHEVIISRLHVLTNAAMQV